MLFNSISFLLFFPIVFFVYWCVLNKSLFRQNTFLLIVSYFFYSCWDYRFLFLLLFSTLLDFYTGLKIGNTNSKDNRKKWLYLSIGLNLGFLCIFKYYNFFIESFSTCISQLGWTFHPIYLKVILPVGISFYTFHGLSYVIDIYYNRISPERNYIDYGLFVSFFPLLVAGPIERATHLLPQLKVKRNFDQKKAVDGLKQILWGFFKKVVIADNCSVFADQIFNSSSELSGSTYLLGAIFFSFQIYGDFSGYSDIALGTSRLLGIELLQNFSFPYFSRDIAEFWRKWHISLSSWFKDYVYIPLGGSKGNTITKVRNIFIIFILSGFWHGANYTFIAWGVLNALYFLPLILTDANRNHLDVVAKNRLFPDLNDFISIIFTFILTTFSWIFFRADTIQDAFDYISKIFSSSLLILPKFENMSKALVTIFLLILFIIIEWNGRSGSYAIQKIGQNWLTIKRWSFYSFILFLIGMYMHTIETPFIYFQF